VTLPPDDGRGLRRPFGRTHVAVNTGTESAAIDAEAINRGAIDAEPIDGLGIPSLVLIEAAGRAAAQVVQHVQPEGPVVVFAGKGNNGADAVVVARTLVSWGRSVQIVTVGGTLSPALLHGWDVPVLELDRAEVEVRGATVVVDGVLGTGLRGRPREPESTAIDRINGAPGLVISLDIASGVSADTGAVLTEAVRADLTIGFGSAKLGSVLRPGRAHTGRLVVVDIGLPPQRDPATRFITPEWVSGQLPQRPPEAHKNSVGAVCVVAGSQGMAGAAVLAARACARIGAGYVRIVSELGNREIIQGAFPEAVFVDRDDEVLVHEAVLASRAVLIGPGIGTDAAATALVERVLTSAMSGAGDSREEHGGGTAALPVVVDADGLTVLGRQGPPDHSRLLLTPHPGEMARLTSTPIEELTHAPLSAARGLAARWQVAVLLKGTPTVVTDVSGKGWIASSQSSDLAVAGMGDTLAGTIAGLAVQGLTRAHAAAVGLEVTARAAMLAGQGAGMVPSDVVEHLPRALRERGAGDTDLPFPCVLFDQDEPR